MVQLSMLGFQITSYSSDIRLSNGLRLLNSGKSLNQLFDHRNPPEFECSQYTVYIRKPDHIRLSDLILCQSRPFDTQTIQNLDVVSENKPRLFYK